MESNNNNLPYTQLHLMDSLKGIIGIIPMNEIIIKNGIIGAQVLLGGYLTYKTYRAFKHYNESTKLGSLAQSKREDRA